MTELSKSLTKLILVIKVKTGDDGKLFGSVTNGTIADELKTQFEIVLDKKKIKLEHSIRTLGEYEVELNLHAEVKGTLKVRVESINPVATPVEAPAEDKYRTEKRGKRTEGEAAEAPADGKAKGEKKPKAEKKA